MNIEQANTIPISLLLDNLGIKPAKKRGKSFIYLSPIRIEKTPSFHLDEEKNVWFDHGIGIGGDCVAFACHWLQFTGEDHTVADALRWIGNMSGQGKIILPTSICASANKCKEERSVIIKQIQPVSQQTLIDYLQQRGIPSKIGRKYLKEIQTYNKELKKHFFALGFRNESGGYELRNRYYKGCAGKKDISVIRGSQPKPEGIHIFEGFMDFLSIVTQREGRAFEDDAIVLNSVSQIKKALELIKGYGYLTAYTWLDNDTAGENATNLLDEFLKTEKNLVHKPQNSRYHHHKDVNAWHMKKLGLCDVC